MLQGRFVEASVQPLKQITLMHEPCFELAALFQLDDCLDWYFSIIDSLDRR